MLTGRIWVCFWPAPGASADRNCLLQLEPPSHERARSWHSQLCYISLIPVLANCSTCRQLSTGHAGAWVHALARRQNGKPKVAHGGCPGRAGCGQAPLGHGNGRAPSSLHGISCCGTPHQPDHRVSWVCLHGSAAQLTGSAPKDRSLAPCSALSGHIPRQLFSVIFLCASSTLVMSRIRGWKCSP